MAGGWRITYASACAGFGLCRIAAVLAALAAAATGRAESAHEASTSQAARQEAQAAIPLAKIDPAYRRHVAEVLADPSVFRRLPTNVVDCQPDMFTFLVQNPEVLVEIWRTLGLSRVELVRTGANTFDLRDNAGTTGRLVVVEQACEAGAQNRIVMYAEGQYDGKPFSRAVGARCVLLLRSGSVRETNGRQYVAARLDSFVKLDRTSVEIMAHLAQPFVGRTADRNFSDTLSFISNLSYTAERRPASIDEIAGELENVDAERRAGLSAVAHRCAEAGAAWELTRAAQASADVSTR